MNKLIITPQEVIANVAASCGMKVDDIFIFRRCQKYCNPRYICIYMLYERFHYKQVYIAKLFGYKDHSVINYAVNKILDLKRSHNPKLFDQYQKCSEAIETLITDTTKEQ